MRSPLAARATGGLLALALLGTACGTPDPTREDLVQSLVDVAGFSDDQATCVADSLYDSGDWTEDELKQAGGDPTEVEGFLDAVDAAVADCTSPS